MTTSPTHKIPDSMNLYQMATDDLAYVSISATDIEGKSSGSVWKFPLPQMIEYNSEFRWSAEDLHQIASGVVDTLTSITDPNESTMEKALQLMKNSGSGMKQMAFRQSANLLGAGNSQALVKELNKVSGNAYNPNEQLYFDGVGLRNFNMFFQLVPMSREEANRMRSSVRAMLYRANPDLTEEKFYFKYPDYFNIKVVVAGHTLLAQKALAITNIACNFSPEGVFTWHDDGLPITYNVTVSVKESQVITRQNLDNITLLGSPMPKSASGGK